MQRSIPIMILFLDFDGVLHPFDRPTGLFSLLPEFECAMRDCPGVDIVISSTWREAHTLEQLRALFSPGIRERIIDVTPVFNMLAHAHVREAEINAWLREAGRDGEPWLAVDDTEWLFAPGCANLLLVGTDTGLDAAALQELRRRLRR